MTTRSNFTNTIEDILDKAVERLAAEIGSDHSLTKPIVTRYVAELVIPEYPRSPGGVVSRVPTGAQTGILAPLRLMFNDEAVDWIVLVQMLHLGGMRERWRIRMLLELCIPTPYSISQLRAIWDNTLNTTAFVLELRNNGNVPNL